MLRREVTSSLKRKWDGMLDSAQGGLLKLDVSPTGGRFKPGSAEARKGGPEKWLTTENSETAAKFLGTVPPNTPVQQYPPSFSGLFLPGGGGAGKGKPEPPKPDDRTWSVASAFDVGNHVHEASGAIKNGNPTGSHEIKPVYDGVKEYDVDCPVRAANGEIVRMITLIDSAKAALVAKYGGDGKEQGLFVPGEPGLAAGKATNVKTGQADPKHGDNNMVRAKITGTFKNDAKYFIAMPKWLQLTEKDLDKQPSQETQERWSLKFYLPLEKHEVLHKEKYEAYVKNVQAVVDTHPKTLYFGEVCYGPGRTAEAKARAIRVATEEYDREKQAVLDEVQTLMTKLQEEQAEYDRITKHGANQKAIGGQNVEYEENWPLPP